MKTRDKACRRCGEPAVARGTVYRLSFASKGKGRPKQTSEHRWMCMRHYLECQFGLWPYTCTKVCERARRKLSDCAQLSEADLLTWIPLDVVVSTKSMRPLCPWCTRKLRAYPLKPADVKRTKKGGGGTPSFARSGAGG